MSGNVVCEYEKNAYGMAGENATLMHNGKHYGDQSQRKIIIVRPGHGSDGTGVGPLQGGFFFEVVRALTDAEYTVYCINGGGPNSWWNAYSTTAFVAAITSMQTRFGVAKVALYGGSMGLGCSLQAVKNSTVQAATCGVAGISGVVDLDYAHGTVGYTPPYTYDTAVTPTFGDWRANCEAADAYNTNAVGWAAATVGHRIHDEPASWSGLPFPIRLWHGDLDQVVPYNQVAWWVDQVNDPTVTLRTLPGAFHTPPTPQYLGPPMQEYLDFFGSLSWS